MQTIVADLKRFDVRIRIRNPAILSPIESALICYVPDKLTKIFTVLYRILTKLEVCDNFTRCLIFLNVGYVFMHQDKCLFCRWQMLIWLRLGTDWTRLMNLPDFLQEYCELYLHISVRGFFCFSSAATMRICLHNTREVGWADIPEKRILIRRCEQR